MFLSPHHSWAHTSTHTTHLSLKRKKKKGKDHCLAAKSIRIHTAASFHSISASHTQDCRNCFTKMVQTWERHVCLLQLLYICGSIPGNHSVGKWKSGQVRRKALSSEPWHLFSKLLSHSQEWKALKVHDVMWFCTLRIWVLVSHHPIKSQSHNSPSRQVFSRPNATSICSAKCGTSAH